MKLLIVLLSLTALPAQAEQTRITVRGVAATAIMDSFTYGEHFNPPYHHDNEIYCKAKEPRGSRSFGYASCTNNSWFDNGTKNAFNFTLALIEALPIDLQQKLVVSREDQRNGYTMSIEVKSLVCNRSRSRVPDQCDIVVDL